MFEYPSKSDCQYDIFISRGGTPYLMGIDFYNYFEAQNYLRNYINTQDKRYRYNYYVDNKFYENDTALGAPKQVYFKIIKRKVTDYIDADFDFEDYKNENSNNIINFSKNILTS